MGGWKCIRMRWREKAEALGIQAYDFPKDSTFSQSRDFTTGGREVEREREGGRERERKRERERNSGSSVTEFATGQDYKKAVPAVVLYSPFLCPPSPPPFPTSSIAEGSHCSAFLNYLQFLPHNLSDLSPSR